MKKLLIILGLISFLLSFEDKCLAQGRNSSDLLNDLFDRLTGNYNDKDRIHINDSIKIILDGFVRSDSAFSYRFDDLKHLGQVTSSDSLIKIVSWNLVLNNEPGRYNCYLIRKQDNMKGNKIYELFGNYDGKAVRTDTTYTISDWYGALYYDLRPAGSDSGRCWILLGIDYGNPEISKKIIDVLSFNSDGSLILGKKWFDSGKIISFRVVFEYASNAMMSLRFRSDNSVIFDHLVPFTPSKQDDHRFYGPDYSFDAYNYLNGQWKLTINVDARNKE